LTPKLRKHHKTDRKSIKPITPNTGKTSCISSDYGFMRPVHRRNNPNWETLVYIPLSHITVIRVYTTRIAKQYYELLISTLLLLLLFWPIYQSMCTGVRSIPHTSIMSKSRLLLETDDEIMGYVYSGSRTYPRPWPRMFQCWLRTCC